MVGHLLTASLTMLRLVPQPGLAEPYHSPISKFSGLILLLCQISKKKKKKNPRLFLCFIDNENKYFLFCCSVIFGLCIHIRLWHMSLYCMCVALFCIWLLSNYKLIEGWACFKWFHFQYIFCRHECYQSIHSVKLRKSIWWHASIIHGKKVNGMFKLLSLNLSSLYYLTLASNIFPILFLL